MHKDIDMPPYSEKDIEVLVSTMNRNNLDFLFQMFPNDMWQNVSILIVNQSENQLLSSDYKNIRIINSKEVGLSKSRNLALKNSKGKLLLITDDDVVFKPNFTESILQGFHTLSSDFICFRYEKNNRLAKNYPTKQQENISWARLLSTTSFEIALKREVLLEKSILFDVHFGINAPFGMGEETIFLADFKNQNHSIGFFPKTVLTHNHDTTGERISAKTTYYRCGAIFYRIFGEKYIFWLFIKVLFDIKQHKIKWFNIPSLIQEGIKGKKDFLSLKSRFSNA